MRIDKLVLAAFAAVLLSGAARAAGEPAGKEVLEQLGFKKHFTLPTTSYERWSHNKDEFLLSKEGFSNRADAAKFCTNQKGFKLGKSILPLMLVMSGFPFPTMKDSHIEDEILAVPQVAKPTTGYVFWAGPTAGKDNKVLEPGLEKEPDTLIAFLDGCGPNCASYPTLRDVNAALKAKGKAPRKIKAACSQITSEDL